MNESRTPAAVPRVHPQTDPLVGRLINGRYKVLALIARGGMGKVYRAEQAPLGRLVALKVLTASYDTDTEADFQRRFFLEASIASKLSHPNTVTIHDYGKTDDDIYYIAMELLEGRTLHRALREEGPFSPERTVHVIRQMCRALREAHAFGVIHRDLKPANVFLVTHGDERDFVKVLDFGLVKNLNEKGESLTQTGLFMGSPKYMSPEQVRGEPVDSRADVYALGVVMCELLTGRVPFDDAHSVNVLMAHVHHQVPAFSDLNPNVQVPPQLEQIAQKCLAKDRRERWASVDEILRALKEYSDADASVPGAQPLPESGTGRPSRGSRTAITVTDRLLAVPADASASSTPQPFAQATHATSSAAPLLFAALLVLAGIAGFIVLSRSFNAAHTPGSTATPSAQPRPGDSARVFDAEQDAVLISLRSTPPGAMVVVGDKQYGPTPTEVELTGEEASPGREVTFRFRRTGYRALTITRRIRGDRLDVEATFMDPIASPHGAGSDAPPR